MRENALIQFSSGRYYQGRGVLQKIGEESALLGHKALIVVDDTVWKKTEERVRESLRSASVEFVRYAFSGGCTEKNYTEASQIGQAEGCTLVIGMGGGRAIDTAKIAADLMGVRCITECSLSRRRLNDRQLLDTLFCILHIGGFGCCGARLPSALYSCGYIGRNVQISGNYI